MRALTGWDGIWNGVGRSLTGGAGYFLAALLIAFLLALGAGAARANGEFAPDDLDIDVERRLPQACITFTKALVRGDVLTTESWVRVEPAADLAAVIRDEQLCLEGFAHGSSYDVTLLPGLASVDGETLGREVTYEVAIPDRSPSVRFASRGHVLPRLGNEGLPVTTVNVDAVAVEILRINDRNLINEIRRSDFGSDIYGYIIDGLKNERGETIWTGVLETAGEKNRTTVTALPITETIGALQPGVYVAVASVEGADSDRWEDRPTQWFVVSDLGLASFMGDEELTVQVRSLTDARPLAGVAITLVATNNKVLGQTATDADGVARFEPGALRGTGGNKPHALFAQGPDGDFVFLDLSQAGFDLSDRGVGGRESPGPLDAFVYTERGIYRPGETVHANILLRSDKSEAETGIPLTVKVVRPDGIEVAAPLAREAAAGGYQLDLPLARSAYTGTWTLSAHAGADAPAIGQTRIQVEDFVPPRIEFDLEATTALIDPEVEAGIGIAARFLYGAPAGNRPGELSVVIAKAAEPFAEYADYHFGLVEEEGSETRPVQLDPIPFETDAEGNAEVPVFLYELPDASQPLEARIRASVFDVGGRPVQKEISVPIAYRPLEIGIDPLFDDDRIRRGAPAGFRIVTLEPDGTPVASGTLRWELRREHFRYNWYRVGQRWDYERTLIHDDVVASGETATGAGDPGTIAAMAERWGYHRLEVWDPDSGVAASYRFYSGWGRPGAEADTPDKVLVTLEQVEVSAGRQAAVFVKPPADAKVMVAVVDNRVRSVRNLEIPEAGELIQVDIPADVGAGAYVIAQAYMPADNEQTYLPTRAVGLTWVKAEDAARTLEVAIAVPDVVRPARTVEVPVTITGATAGEQVSLTLAAVDDGVLQLTGFTAPDPHTHFLGKRRLALDLRDVYGRLIDPEGAAAGPIRSGGDGDGNRQLQNLPDPNIEVLSLHSGIVTVGADGTATIPLDLPDFNGRARLMAVAWSADRVGNAETTMTIRAPVIADLSLPRFLAPDDRASVAFALDNVDGPAGDYRLELATGGAITLADGSSADSIDLTLGAGQRMAASIDISAAALGGGTLDLTLNGPEGFTLARDWSISVRPGNPYITRRSIGSLQPGSQLSVDAETLLAGLRPESAEITVGLSQLPEFDVAGLVGSLSRYPYGCVEQTTSQALPLLYLSDVARSAGLGDDGVGRRVLVRAIDRVVNMQTATGGFGVWSPNDETRSWLTAYVMDFLTRAREQNLPVPERAYRRGLRALQRMADISRPDDGDLPAMAYAHYVLARAGSGELSQARQFQRTQGQRLVTALSGVQTAAALAGYGDIQLARSQFAAVDDFTRPPQSYASGFYDYGSELRDLAAMVTLGAESDVFDGPELFTFAERISAILGRETGRTYHSTQEKAWLLLATHALMEQAEPVDLVVNGLPYQSNEPYLARLEADGLGDLVVRNEGRGPVNRILTVAGIPTEPEPAEERGFSIRRYVFDRSGSPINPASVGQSDLMVVVLDGRFADVGPVDALLVDLLPAGFEIENVRLDGSADLGDFAWLGELTPTRHVEYRDDRFVAAVDVDPDRQRAFRVAYLVRAVTPGTYFQPGPFVEAMYRPHLFARGRSGSVVVTP